MHSWDNKDSGASAGQKAMQDAAKEALKGKSEAVGDGEPDMEPSEVRPLAQIHKDLGRHLPPEGDTGEADGSPIGRESY